MLTCSLIDATSSGVITPSLEGSSRKENIYKINNNNNNNMLVKEDER